MIKKIGVLTSGGDAPGMNAAIRGVVRAALTKAWKFLAFMTVIWACMKIVWFSSTVTACLT